ncbi:MAG: transglycosylase SLT domain-containing protein, partial [Elusimicrobiales bacterium]|nr:transglycosylase SLT domain-containing protein [Elusimicrobiales bacterium]
MMKNSPSALLLLSAVIVTVLNTSGCSTPTVWGYSPHEFRRLAGSGELPHFTLPDLSGVPFDELDRLGGGAAYFLSYHDFTDPHAARILLMREIGEGDEPYAYAAMLRLMRLLIGSGDYRGALSVAEQAPSGYRSRYEWRRLLLDAAYWGREDARALRLLNSLMDDFPSETESEAELRLFDAVLLQRNGAPLWPEALLNLFSDIPAGALHVRAYDYLRLEGLLDNFSEAERKLLRGVDLAARNEDGPAWNLLAPLAADGLLTGPGSLRTLARAALQAGRGMEARTLIASLRGQAADTHLLELEAFILRTAGNHREALPLYRELAGLAEGETAERFRWYAFSSLVKTDPAAAVEELPRLMLLTELPGYYNDVLAELVSILSIRREWEEIITAYTVLDGAAETRLLARYAYIAARSVESGLASGRLDLPPGEIYRRLWAGEYPGAAAAVKGESSRPNPYYRLLAAIRLGLTPRELLLFPGAEAPVGADDLLAAGFIEYGLFPEAAEIAASGDVSAPAAAAVAVSLLEEGYVEQGLRLLLRRNLPASAEFYYPRPFRREAERWARAEDVPPWLLFALMREESLFNAEAVSRVGARGLTQLMPATAADVALVIGNHDYQRAPDALSARADARAVAEALE